MSDPQLPDRVDEFSDGREFKDVPLVSPGHKPPVTELVMNEGDQALRKIALLLSLFKGTRRVRYLELAQNVGKELKKHPASQGKRTSEHLILQKLICGKESFDLSEAKEASQACKKLWFSGPHIAQPPTVSMQPKHLLRLARGLRAGAMGSTVIPERVYRAFVLLFCNSATNGELAVDAADVDGPDVDGPDGPNVDKSDDVSDVNGSDVDGSQCSEELVDMISTAYNEAVGVMGSSVALSPNATEDPGNSANAIQLFIEAQKEGMQLIREIVEIELNAELRALGLASWPDSSKKAPNYQSCIRRLGEAEDFDQFKDALQEFGLLSTMRAHRLVSAVDGQLAEELSSLSVISAELAELQGGVR